MMTFAGMTAIEIAEIICIVCVVWAGGAMAGLMIGIGMSRRKGKYANGHPKNGIRIEEIKNI